VKWARFEHVGVFRYSDEETAASNELEGKVKPAVAAKRWRKLMSLQRTIARAKNKTLIGRELEVLVEGASEEHELVMMGRHRGQAPEIDGQVYLSGGDVLPGQMRRVTITQASDYDLVGDVLDEGDAAPAAKKKRVSLKVLGNTAPRAHQ
jgi:ribosomal protein S12 methylthiotransferase